MTRNWKQFFVCQKLNEARFQLRNKSILFSASECEELSKHMYKQYTQDNPQLNIYFSHLKTLISDFMNCSDCSWKYSNSNKYMIRTKVKNVRIICWMRIFFVVIVFVAIFICRTETMIMQNRPTILLDHMDIQWYTHLYIKLYVVWTEHINICVNKYAIAQSCILTSLVVAKQIAINDNNIYRYISRQTTELCKWAYIHNTEFWQ